MGFGSYDESEQQRRNENSDEDDGSEGVNVHEHDHDGKMTFESDASTSDLLAKLDGMKDDEDDE